MDLLRDRIRPTYFRYLSAAFGSALISSIYSAVDMAMVGQYHGSDGTAALAVVAPLWNVLYSLGLLFGIGGSVLFSSIRGKDRDEASIRKSNICYVVTKVKNFFQRIRNPYMFDLSDTIYGVFPGLGNFR